MLARVRLLNGFAQPLLYSIPSSLQQSLHPGSVIRVPLQKKIIPAVVLNLLQKSDVNVSFSIRNAHCLELFPADELYHSFIQKISLLHMLEPFYFYQRLRTLMFSSKKNTLVENSTIKQHDQENLNRLQLTQQQQAVIDYMQPHIVTPSYKPTLLHGVTCSGKTEVYKTLMLKAIDENKSVIFLLPEVSLSLQFEHILHKELPGDILLYSFHSLTSVSEKKALWQTLVQGGPCIIIGVHLPVFLPIKNLGLILVDEEHERSFQEKKHPKINSKHAAITRAHHYNIAIVLGSATVSLRSLYNVTTKKWKLFELTKRFGGVFPKIQHVILTHNKHRKSFWVSIALLTAINERIKRNEQTIIYLNRRGYSFFIQCKGCGYTPTCNNCSVSLTLHKQEGNRTLRCHYCGYHISMPNKCVSCNGSKKDLLKKGIGTQQLVTILQNLLPHARIARADLDSTKKKRQWATTLKQFNVGNIDVLVGTQVITKGYHFTNVTLVGVIWADLNIHFPVYDAGITTLQKLIQVAGRAGRGGKASTIILQTMHNHELFKYVDEQQYKDFCQKELAVRQETGYPPYKRLLQIELKNTDAHKVQDDAAICAQALHTQAALLKSSVVILGPARPIVYRVQRSESQQIFMKASSFSQGYAVLNILKTLRVKSSIFVTPIE